MDEKKFNDMPNQTKHEILFQAISNVNTRLEDFMSYSKERDDRMRETMEGINRGFKTLNGSVSRTIERVSILEHNHSICPVNNISEDVGYIKRDMAFWMFIGKNWHRTLWVIALFAGILIGSYSAVTTLMTKATDAIEDTSGR